MRGRSPASVLAAEPTIGSGRSARPAGQRGRRDGDDGLPRQDVGDVGLHMLGLRRADQVRHDDEPGGGACDRRSVECDQAQFWSFVREWRAICDETRHRESVPRR